jgi:hypothetical protein
VKRAGSSLSRCLAAVVWGVAFLGVASPSFATDYTGAWKVRSDFYGVSIEHVAAGRLYSISFCGYGCFKPGTWTPNSPIEGDPKYKIMSSSEIGIRRFDPKRPYDVYVRCSTDPTWHAPAK